MSSQLAKISFCIPVYNEEQIVLSQVDKIQKGLRKMLGSTNYEIVIVENGSTDKTRELLKRVNTAKIRVFSIKERGHGAALKYAIARAKYEYIVLNAIDIPFGFDDIQLAMPALQHYDIVFGSKAHPKSQVSSTFDRKIASWGYRFLLRIFFHVAISDTQGSVFLKKRKIAQILPYCTAKDAFFSSQLAIYGKYFGLSMIEIPVTLWHEKVRRKSKYNILFDSSKILYSMLEEYIKFNKGNTLSISMKVHKNNELD